MCNFLRFGFYDNTDNRDNGLILNSMLSVDNNKNNFYQSKGWFHLRIVVSVVFQKPQLEGMDSNDIKDFATPAFGFAEKDEA